MRIFVEHFTKERMILFSDGQSTYTSKDPKQIEKWAKANKAGREKLAGGKSAENNAKPNFWRRFIK